VYEEPDRSKNQEGGGNLSQEYGQAKRGPLWDGGGGDSGGWSGCSGCRGCALGGRGLEGVLDMEDAVGPEGPLGVSGVAVGGDVGVVVVLVNGEYVDGTPGPDTLPGKVVYCYCLSGSEHGPALRV
jgi:hypothetical protein